jgi:outer membrane lipoprotein-sorting protein
MRSLWTTALMILAPVALAADAPPQALAVWEAMSQVRSVQANFVQVQYRSLLSKPLESTGTLAFTRPDQILWRVEHPAKSIFVINGTKVGMAYPDLGVREEMDLAGNPEAERLTRGMMVWLAGDLAQVTRDYDLAWQPGPPAVAVLTPKDETLAALLSKIELTISGDPPRVESVVMHEPDGDRIEITLTDLVLDPTLPPDTFRLP